MNQFQFSSDKCGVLSSALCILHCLATPFLFVLNTCSDHCHDQVPVWWGEFDYLFLGVSFLAIWYSTQETSSQMIKPLFWLGWVVLAFAILNEKLHLLEIPHFFIYIPTVYLIFIHIYNLKFCQCQPEEEAF